MIGLNFGVLDGTPEADDLSGSQESGLDRALRYVKSGAGIALGVVAIVEGFRGLYHGAEGLRTVDGVKPDRLVGARALFATAGDVVGGFIDTRRHVGNLRR